MIITERLTLMPATVDLARAELDDRSKFAHMLGAVVPDDWPPASAADALPLFLGWLEAAPERSGWFGWYGLARPDLGGPAVLVASGGFLGPPASGAVRLGYSVLPEFQRRGYATEMVNGLLRWAFTHPEVEVVESETEWANPASARVLEKAGFVASGPALESGGSRYELRPSPGAA